MIMGGVPDRRRDHQSVETRKKRVATPGPVATVAAVSKSVSAAGTRRTIDHGPSGAGAERTLSCAAIIRVKFHRHDAAALHGSPRGQGREDLRGQAVDRFLYPNRLKHGPARSPAARGAANVDWMLCAKRKRLQLRPAGSSRGGGFTRPHARAVPELRIDFDLCQCSRSSREEKEEAQQQKPKTPDTN